MNAERKENWPLRRLHDVRFRVFLAAVDEDPCCFESYILHVRQKRFPDQADQKLMAADAGGLTGPTETTLTQPTCSFPE